MRVLRARLLPDEGRRGGRGDEGRPGQPGAHRRPVGADPDVQLPREPGERPPHRLQGLQPRRRPRRGARPGRRRRRWTPTRPRSSPPSPRAEDGRMPPRPLRAVVDEARRGSTAPGSPRPRPTPSPSPPTPSASTSPRCAAGWSSATLVDAVVPRHAMPSSSPSGPPGSRSSTSPAGRTSAPSRSTSARGSSSPGPRPRSSRGSPSTRLVACSRPDAPRSSSTCAAGPARSRSPSRTRCPSAVVAGVEMSELALAWAARNRDRLGLAVELVLGDASGRAARAGRVRSTSSSPTRRTSRSRRSRSIRRSATTTPSSPSTGGRRTGWPSRPPSPIEPRTCSGPAGCSSWSTPRPRAPRSLAALLRSGRVGRRRVDRPDLAGRPRAALVAGGGRRACGRPGPRPTLGPMSPVFDCTTPEGLAEGIAAAAAASATARSSSCPRTPSTASVPTRSPPTPSRRSSTPRAAAGRCRRPSSSRHAQTVDGLARDVPAYARSLIERFWPGPLTLVLKAHESLAWDLGDTGGTVALRMPDDPVALALLTQVGPMAVSSANRTGQPAATTRPRGGHPARLRRRVLSRRRPRPAAVRRRRSSTARATTPVILREGALCRPPTSRGPRTCRRPSPGPRSGART